MEKEVSACLLHSPPQAGVEEVARDDDDRRSAGSLLGPDVRRDFNPRKVVSVRHLIRGIDEDDVNRVPRPRPLQRLGVSHAAHDPDLWFANQCGDDTGTNDLVVIDNEDSSIR
jgi:hypothetical protein